MKLSWPGRQKRALLIRANGAEAYTLRRGAITLEAAFALSTGNFDLFEKPDFRYYESEDRGFLDQVRRLTTAFALLLRCGDTGFARRFSKYFAT